MPNWKKLVTSGSDAFLNKLNVTNGITGSLFGSASWSNNSLTASYVTTLNQDVLITGSLTIGTSSLGSNENTLILGPSPAGGAGEGGQLLLQAPNSGGFTSASMIDNYQNRLRILRGTNAGSDAEVATWNMHSKQMQLPAYNSLGAFSGTAVAALGVNSNGDVITIQTGSQAGGSGVTINNNTDNYILTATGIANTINGESGLTYNGLTLSVTGNVTANSFTGSLLGAHVGNTTGTASWATNATNATSATNATNINVKSGPGGAKWYIPFVSTLDINTQPYGVSSLQFDTSTGILTATSSYSITSSVISVIQNSGSNTFFPTFVDSDNSTADFEQLYTTSTISFRPGLGRIGCTSVSAASLTGSLLGTASNALTASFVTGTIFTGNNLVRSASYALTASYLLGGGPGSPGGSDSTIQYNSGGSFAGSDNFKFINSINKVLITGSILVSGSGVGIIDSQNLNLRDTTNTPSVEWGGRFLRDTLNNRSVAWEDRELRDTNGLATVQWNNNRLSADDGTSTGIYTAVDWFNNELLVLDNTVTPVGLTSVNWLNRTLYATDGNSPQLPVQSVDWGNRYLIDSSGANWTVSWETCQLGSTQVSLNWSTRQLIATDGSTTVLDWTDTATARLYGTSSYALTASYVIGGGGGTPLSTLVQSTPSNSWTFTHGLGISNPIVTVYDSNNKVIIPQEISASNSNTLIITFPLSTTGTAVAAGGTYTGVTPTNAVTASYALLANTASYALLANTASYVSGYATLTSNTFTGNQTISGSLTFSLPTSPSFNGEIVKFGAGTLTAGQLYFLSSSGTWSLANATSTSSSIGMLGIAVGSSPTMNGLLIRGFAATSSYNFGTGDILYMATGSGLMTNTSPSSSNHVVRVMGYQITEANTIYFDPDKTWVTLA